MLKERLVTAIVLLLIVGVTLFYLPPVYFIALAVVFIAVAFWEWSNLSDIQALPLRLVYVAIAIAGLAGLLSIVVMPMHADIAEMEATETLVSWQQLKTYLAIGCTWWAVALLWVKGYPSSAILWGSRAARALIGFLVLLPALLALSYLRLLPNGVWCITYVVLCVAAADTGAYFAGRIWGKSKLAPKVSPGKSWAGFWGGLTAVATLSTIVGVTNIIPQLTLVQLIIISLLTGVASVLGDLLESMIKRHRGVKDSGTILPGHGGVLDRIDSMTAAAPVFALLFLLVGQH